MNTICSRPEFSDAPDFDFLKATFITPGKAMLFVGRLPDLGEHLDHLFQEFQGQPLIIYYHAELVVRLRRGENLHSAFKDLWRAQEAFLINHLNSRWLVSACDTIVDCEESDSAERCLALAASLLMTTLKLYETERKACALDKTAGRHRSIAIQPLFDGLATFAIGRGDLIKNVTERANSVVANSSTAGQILLELIRRVHLHDTVFRRFLDVHVHERTRWAP